MSKLFTVTERVWVGLNIKDGAACSIPLSQGLLRLMRRQSTGMQDICASLLAADLAGTANGTGEEQLRWITEKDGRDRRAFVCVHVACQGVESCLLASTKQEEVLNDRRVIRKYRPFEEAVGCRLVQQTRIRSATEQSENATSAYNYLIEMLPGASFLVCRAGEIEDAPSILHVRWEGRWDMSGLATPADALDPERYGLYVHREHKRKNRYVPAEAMPSFQAR